MPSSEDYKAKAHQCLTTAEQTSDAVTASLLRMLAADHFELAERAETPVDQQQQQIQPKGSETDKT
jgi:hypothetical protein